MADLVALRSANARRFAVARTARNFTSVARALVASSAKARYQTVSARTGVPWYFIAVVHEREASQNWNTQLGQGDPLNQESTHVPAGRGPFKTWEDGAFDALVNCAPYPSRNKDWSVGALLTELEKYNGLGYANRGVPSPYVWAGTDQYKSGKYTADGIYNPNAVDTQPGCAGLLMTMMQLDPTITFTGLKITPSPTVPTTLPPPVAAAPQSLGARIASIFSSIFGRKS